MLGDVLRGVWQKFRCGAGDSGKHLFSRSPAVRVVDTGALGRHLGDIELLQPVIDGYVRPIETRNP
jgi:hypothetical protein